MVSELIVMVISGKEDINDARQLIEKNHGGGLFSLIDIVRIRHDTSGKISFQVRRRDIDHFISDHRCLAGAFAEIIFDSLRAEGRSQLAEAGVDPFFMRKVIDALKPNNLAYLMYVPRESQIDSRRFLAILEEQQGDLCHTTFQSQVEEVLLKQIG